VLSLLRVCLISLWLLVHFLLYILCIPHLSNKFQWHRQFLFHHHILKFSFHSSPHNTFCLISPPNCITIHDDKFYDSKGSNYLNFTSFVLKDNYSIATKSYEIVDVFLKYFLMFHGCLKKGHILSDKIASFIMLLNMHKLASFTNNIV